MFDIEVKKHGICMKTVWYADKPINQKGIICYREATKPFGKGAILFDTLLTDLLQTEDEIIEKISKNGRYEIRRAAKENVETKMIMNSDVTAQVINDFCDFFVEFWKSKDVIYKARDALYDEINQYVKKEAFALSIAYIKGRPYVYHTYLIDKENVRLYHSASLYRIDEEVPHSLIGMANRYLHKEDMMYFKQIGKQLYDWGGAGKTEEVKSITEFKQSFGGVPARYYDCTVVNGPKAKVITLLSGVKSKLGKK